MANKLKIFEKLRLIEKKDNDSYLTESDSEFAQAPLDGDQVASGESDLTASMQDSDEVYSEKFTSMAAPIEAPANEHAQDSVQEHTKASNDVIEDVEKKLDAMIESYERNKLMSIEDIYRKANLILDVKSTVFMVDVYAKALPENLPLDVKRDSVLNIMKASDLRVDDLLSDAYKRIDALNNVLESVVQTTDEMKVKNNSTIRDLEKRIEELKRNIVEREKFQETQNTTIEYEIQRIINIVDFVKPK